MNVPVHVFPNADSLVEVLCPDVIALLGAAIQRRGVALLAVSGGRTPLSLFQALSRESLDWQKVWITLVDERWVDESLADSNARQVRDNLLRGYAAAANFVGFKTADSHATDGLPEIRTRLAGLPWPIDCTLLGMGNDGHTASFFPGAANLAQALAPDSADACVVVDPPVAPHQRVTLTLACLLRSRSISLHLAGTDKWMVLQRALEPGPVDELPVRAVFHQTRAPIAVYYAAQE